MLTNDDKIEVCKLIKEIVANTQNNNLDFEYRDSMNVFDKENLVDAINETIIDLLNENLREVKA